MDDELDRLIKGDYQAKAARFARRHREEQERLLAKAREVLGTTPPPVPVSARRLEKVFEAPPPADVGDGQTATIEGIVFDAYGIESGRMGGDIDFAAFEMVTDGERVTRWHDDYPEVNVGKGVRIKCVSRDGRVTGYDHCDDTVLEVWVERP